MKKQACQMLLALTLLATLMVPATQAQSIILKADVPFDFVVGNRQLPSGEYQVKSADQGTLLIQSKDASSSAMVLTMAVQAKQIPDTGKLVFNRYGDQYFLSKIWTPSSATGRELPKSRLEREVAAQSTVKPGATAVAAKR
jgi:hypothetical protein